jgi:uncharacterized membrane protein YphA (DoxX/SURF4 family)
MDAVWNDLAMILAEAGMVCAGLVFASAGVQKLRHRTVLRGVISNYRLLPDFAVAPVAAVQPPVEMVLGFLLLAGLVRPWASLGAMLMLTLFAAAMAINIRRGRSHIDCGCGGPSLRQALRWSLVARNLLLAAALLPSLAVTDVLPLPVVAAGAGAGAVFFVLYAVANALAALPRRNASGTPVAV